MLADELVGDVENLAPVLPDDEIPRRLIASQTLLDQAIWRSRLRGRGVNGHASSTADALGEILGIITERAAREGQVRVPGCPSAWVPEYQSARVPEYPSARVSERQSDLVPECGLRTGTVHPEPELGNRNSEP